MIIIMISIIIFGWLTIQAIEIRRLRRSFKEVLHEIQTLMQGLINKSKELTGTTHYSRLFQYKEYVIKVIQDGDKFKHILYYNNMKKTLSFTEEDDKRFNTPTEARENAERIIDDMYTNERINHHNQ